MLYLQSQTARKEAQVCQKRKDSRLGCVGAMCSKPAVSATRRGREVDRERSKGKTWGNMTSGDIFEPVSVIPKSPIHPWILHIFGGGRGTLSFLLALWIETSDSLASAITRSGKKTNLNRRYMGLWITSLGNIFSQLSSCISISVFNNSRRIELPG